MASRADKERHVLLVEDNPDDEELALRALSRVDPNILVTVARDGNEALQRLVPNGESTVNLPDLVLLDLKIPKLNGFEVLKKVRGVDKLVGVPIVVLTSSDESSDILACYQNGVNSYVRKEVDFMLFLESIEEIVKYWLFRNVATDRSETRYH